MTLEDIGEFGFIDRIKRGCLVRPEGVVQAIGDDAAAFELPRGQVALVTTDLLVERIHFLREAITGFNLGHKALAVNLSDIAAMGGTAREAFISIAIAADCALEFLDDLYRGMRELAADFDVNLLGGDTTRSPKDLVINIGVVGCVDPDRMLTRAAARPGDRIFSTGYLGDSRAGLHLIVNHQQPLTEDHKALLEAHVRPHPCLAEGIFIAGQKGAHACIDVSDGLSSDLGHILAASRVGARLWTRHLPISTALERFCREFDFNAIDYALTGGEDYALLATVAPDRADAVRQAYADEFSRPLFEIGEITDSGRLERVDESGATRIVQPQGWDHFTS